MQKQLHPELKDLAIDASRALTLLDADRLQELALSCQVLHRELDWDPKRNGSTRKNKVGSELARQAREAARDMSIFARVLDMTRANVKVMHRLREMRASRLEYGESNKD